MRLVNRRMLKRRESMARSKTYIATPPGATIKERLEYRGMSQREFARRMDYSEKFISQLINGQWSLLRILHIGSRWFWVSLRHFG